MALKLYIAGPVSGRELANRPEFERARRQLESAGYEVVVPHDVVPRNETWYRAMRACLREMLDCSGVALLDGWDASRGARLEETVAWATKLPCEPVGAWLYQARCRRRSQRAGA